jgi:hypothetical protein
LSGQRAAGTIRDASTGRDRGALDLRHLVAALLRRVASLLAAALLLAALVPSAMGAGRDVLSDYEDNGVINGCYTLAEYREALRIARADQAQYGSALERIAEARATRVKRPGETCEPLPTEPAATEDDDSGVSPILWVVIGLVVVGVAMGAGALARRRGSG